MSQDGFVRSSPLIFGTTGTSTSLADTTTNTSQPVMLPRSDYTVQLTVVATGTSGVGATVIWQGSNDNQAWIEIGSATATTSQAGTGTTRDAAALAISGNRFSVGRAATVIVTGTGAAHLDMGI